MGSIKLIKEGLEDKYPNGVVNKQDMKDLEDISSLPFQVDIGIPVHKVVCGHDFSALLTVEGQVFTWGLNTSGQLGLGEDKVGYRTQIDESRPLSFINQSQNSNKRKQPVVDLAAGFGQMIALTD